MRHKPTILIILDGYGVNAKAPQSTWNFAKMPMFRELEKNFPFTTLQASGPAVGLPWGQEGNSEVGHLTIGAGRVIYSHLPRIIFSIRDGSFFKNGAFLRAIKHVKEKNSALHLMGLFSSGSVHSYAEHLYALLDLAETNNLKKVYLHLFTDGRDAHKWEAAKFLKMLEERLEKKYPFAKIASIIGRKFAMDRDGKWEFTKKAYNLFAEREGEEYEHLSLFVEKNYKQKTSDESIPPGFLKSGSGSPDGRISENDSVIFFNYREDSARQLTEAFVAENFSEFRREKIKNLLFATMTEYKKGIPALVAFPPLDIHSPIAGVVSEMGLSQIHIAESEKYAHVTYFFNGGREKPFPGEERVLVGSPETSNYADVPEMSSFKITESVIDSIKKYDFILANFANADMVGHTGNFDATIRAIEALDKALSKIVPAVLKTGGAIIIVGDHGNAEEKIYAQTGEERTEHTPNPVPMFLVGNGFKTAKKSSPEEIDANYKTVKGVLADVSPTVLNLLDLPVPLDMTGISLLDKFGIKKENKEINVPGVNKQAQRFIP